MSPDLILPTDFVISNPASISASTSAARGRASISAAAAPVVYVSLPPRTFPNAAAVWIQNQSRGGSVLNVQLTHNGFDPVPIEASDGDVLKLTVFDPGGATITKTLRVPARRPPTIVRSDPGEGRTDIALNVSVTAVFSEPIDAKTVTTTSVHLLKEGNPVSGRVVLVDSLWTVMFVPAKPLDPQSSYELVVTPAVLDLDGDALGGSYRANFVTGTIVDSPCPGYADPADCPPFPTGGSGVITGVISVRTTDGIKPLAGATVFGWVQLGFRGRGYARGGTKADSAGRFIVNTLPKATIMLQGSAAGYDQPCAAVVEFNGITALTNIELVSQAHPLLDVANKPPIIKGVVYEVTPAGRQPVAGAQIYIDELEDLISATTTTDENGRYAVCQIPDFGYGQTVYAVKTGYQTGYKQVSVSGTTELQLDIELKH